MTPQEIGLIVVLVVIAGYVIAALLSRSKSREERPDIVLEARLPKAAKPGDALIPAAGVASQKNTRRPRKKSAPPRQSEVGENPPKTRTQHHHASPKPDSKAAPKPESVSASPAEKKPEAAAAPVAASVERPAVPAATALPVTRPEPEPAELIDPELTGQITELDDRLDAIEKLVASIEESLASFEGLEDSQVEEAGQSGEARAA